MDGYPVLLLLQQYQAENEECPSSLSSVRPRSAEEWVTAKVALDDSSGGSTNG